RDPRRDAGGEHLVDEPLVEVEALGVGRPPAARLHAGPADREPVGRQPQLGHEGHVVAVAVDVVARDVAGVSVDGLARRVAEGVPDGRRTSVLRGRTLDLVRGGGRAPEKAGRKCEFVAGHALTEPSMMPPMIWRPNTMNTSSNGTMASAVP